MYFISHDSLSTYSHECSNHKENQLYHFISLGARTPISPSCPCFQHFIIKTPKAHTFLHYVSEIPQNASIIWNYLIHTNSENTELAIFLKK